MPESDPVCAARGIPEHLHQLGREADQEFVGEERLFVRCRPTDAQIKNVISFRRQSCNRSKYCEGGAGDVLFDSEHGGRHHEYTGVVAITVAAVRAATAEITGNIRKGESETTRYYTLRPEHKPEPCNYAHTEIVACCNGSEDPDSVGPSSVKKRLRDELAERYQWVLPPEREGERLKNA